MSDKLSYCPNSQGVIYDKVENTVRQSRCNKSECPYCGPLKRWILARRIDWGIEALYRMGRYIVFFTLTTSRESHPELIMKYWARYRAFLHWYHYEHEYAITVERKGGLVHIHGIGDRFIPYNLMMAAWWSATGKTAWKVDIRKVDMNNAPSWYLVKYVTKGSGSSSAPPGSIKRKTRKVNFSRGFPKRPKAVKEPGRYIYLTYDDYGSIKDMVGI